MSIVMFAGVLYLPLFQQTVCLGGSLGVTAFGSLFTHALDGRTPDDGRAYLDGVAQGTGSVFLALAVLCAAWFAASWLIKEVALRGKPGK
ncbi:hypothetical protein [Streptomyces sp. NPDC085937]|uniref:hypothetical protein n=1 Tax=Streptomyces sp. NPDC085937 TaxID=3365742 RepID=UPI0037D7FEA6